MKSLILFFFLFITICIVKLHAQNAPGIEWQKSFGGSADDVIRSVRQTTDEGFILAGYSFSTDGDVSGNHGNGDYWVVKLNGGGDIVWQKTFGGSLGDYAYEVQQTTDGGFIVAGNSYSNDGDVSGNHGNADYWIVKLDSIGNLMWQKSLGGSSDDLAISVEQSPDGGFIVAGNCYSNDGDVSGNHGHDDYWIVKLDSDGSIVWQKSFGGSEQDVPASVRNTIDGNFIVAGFSGSADGDVSGNHGSSDFWVVKFSISGDLIWQKCLGGTDLDDAASIQQTVDGGFLVGGSSRSNDGDVSGNHGPATIYDYWVVKLDSVGNIQWQKCLGGSSNDDGNSVDQASDKGFVIAGSSVSDDGDVSGNNGDWDYWVVKLDSVGNINWQKSLGGSARDWAYSIQHTVSGGFILAGNSRSLNNDVTENQGGSDAWIVKLQGLTGVNEPLALSSQISISPNPASNLIGIELQSQTNSTFSATITITNFLGEIVSETRTQCINGHLQEAILLDEKFNGGIYLVRVSSEQEQWSAPLVVGK